MATSVTMLDPTGTARQIPADQKDAALKAGGKLVVKMLDPKGTARWIPEDQKDEALKAGGKLALSTPTTTSSTPASSNPLIKPGEGQYQMKDKSGKTVPVSYSNVLAATHNGYQFADKNVLSTFAADHAADPNNSNNRSDQTIKAMSNWNPLKYLASIGAGVQDVLEGTGGEVIKTATAFDRPATTTVETQAQLAAQTGAQNIGQEVGALGEQVGELATVPESKIAEAQKLAELPKLARTGIKVAEQGARAAGEQGSQSYVKSGGDVEQAKQTAEVGGPLGAISAFSAPVLQKAGRFVFEVEKFFNRVSDIDTAKIVRSEMQANEDVARKAAQVRADNAAKVAEAEKAYKVKVDAAKAKYDEAVAGRKTAEEKAALKQQQAEEQSRLDHEHEVEKSRLAHEKSLADQQELEARTAIARRTELETRTRLATRLQTIRDAAKAYFKKNYDDIAEKVGDKTVSNDTLVSLVNDAQKHFEGSSENVKPFRDILSKAERGEIDIKKVPKGYEKEEWKAETPERRMEIWQDILHEEGAAQEADFNDLKGYYSEAGKLLASESTPGDVKQALVKFREGIDGLQQEMADDAGVGQRYKLLRSQYKNYAEGFLDYHGPKGEASAVAKAVRKDDAFNATKDFPKMEPEEISKVKQILAGSPTNAATQFVEGNILTPSGRSEPAFRYRRDASRLLDNFIAASRKADGLETKLSKAKPVGEFVPPEYKPPKPLVPKEQKPIGEFKPPEQKPPKLAKEPQPSVMTPEKLREMKQDALNKTATIVGRFGIYMAAGGLIGGVYQLIKTGEPLKAAEGAGEGIAVGFGGGAVAPYIMARLIDRDDVIQSLTKVTHRDLVRLARMPFKERAEISEALKQLAEEAEAKGKLEKPSPWLRILGGTTARRGMETIRQGGQGGQGGSQPVTLDDLEKLNQDLGRSADQTV